MKKANYTLGKLIIVLFFVAFIFAGFENVFAQGNIKIAVVDLVKVLRFYNEDQKISLKLQEEIQKKQNEIDKSKAEVLKLREDLDKNIDSISEKEKEKKQKNLEGKMKNLQMMVKDSNQELRDMESKMEEEIYVKIKDIVDRIALQNGYTLIFNKRVILYNLEQDDITDKVISELKKSK